MADISLWCCFMLNNILMHSILNETCLIRLGNLDKHVLSAWIFVFVRMPWGEDGSLVRMSKFGWLVGWLGWGEKKNSYHSFARRLYTFLISAWLAVLVTPKILYGSISGPVCVAPVSSTEKSTATARGPDIFDPGIAVTCNTTCEINDVQAWNYGSTPIQHWQMGISFFSKLTWAR